MLSYAMADCDSEYYFICSNYATLSAMDGGYGEPSGTPLPPFGAHNAADPDYRRCQLTSTYP
jgi:hypothetical protein